MSALVPIAEPAALPEGSVSIANALTCGIMGRIERLADFGIASLSANSGHNECHSITASARTHVRRWRAGEKIFTHGREEIDHF